MNLKYKKMLKQNSWHAKAGPIYSITVMKNRPSQVKPHQLWYWCINAMGITLSGKDFKNWETDGSADSFVGAKIRAENALRQLVAMTWSSLDKHVALARRKDFSGRG